MIYYDFLGNISHCFLCETLGTKACQCSFLEVYVYEMKIFWQFEGSPEDFVDKNNAKCLNYQKQKKALSHAIKQKYPLAKELIFYPNVAE